ncbi:MAG: YggT family protein [Atribacterota bacterium]
MVLIEFIFKLLDIYTFIIIIRAILSWTQIDPYNPLFRFVYALTEPVLRPLRLLISAGSMGIDFSPIIAILLIQLFKRIIVGLL